MHRCGRAAVSGCSELSVSVLREMGLVWGDQMEWVVTQV